MRWFQADLPWNGSVRRGLLVPKGETPCSCPWSCVCLSAFLPSFLAFLLSHTLITHLLWTQVIVAHRGQSLTCLPRPAWDTLSTARANLSVTPQAKTAPLRAVGIARDTENYSQLLWKVYFLKNSFIEINSHTMQFTYLRCIIQWFFVCYNLFNVTKNI